VFLIVFGVWCEITMPQKTAASPQPQPARSVLRPCCDCGMLLHDGENIEYSDGTYCKDCSDAKEQTPAGVTDNPLKQ
jgi:hypothetical protein